MPLPTTGNGKSNPDSSDDGIEISSIGASRQPTLTTKASDHSGHCDSRDSKNEAEKISAQKFGSDRRADDQSPASMEESYKLRNKSVVSVDGKRSGVTTPKSNHVPDGREDESHFEDEHCATDNHLAPRIISSPTSQQQSLEISPAGIYDDTAAAFAAQQRQDDAFVQKFWTAYDEILILSIFTQVGILCRLGAAYWFRYFDNVFHSNSALFTNLPLNCLSCFVMGLLCSGESLMEVIVTRFTPPRLQQDLHKEAMQQLEEFQEDEMSCETYSQEIENGDETIGGIRTNKGWPRRRGKRIKQRENEGRNTVIRSGNLFRRQNQQQAQSSELFDEMREVQLLAWERRIRASVCLLLFPVRKEDVDMVENYFDEGYRKGSSPEFTEGRIEEEVEDPERVTATRLEHTIDKHSVALSSAGQATMGGFDDLTFEEEIDDCPRPSKPNIRMLSSQSATPKKLQAKETSPERTEEITVETPIKQSAANEVPIGLNQAESTDNYLEHGRMHARGKVHFSARQYGQVDGGNVVDYGTQDSPDPGQIFSNMATGVSNKISFIRRVNLANGWDVGASPQEKSEDLTLGLRDGLCGALSSFSSWISSMVNLFRDGKIGEAFVGLMLGIQLPLVSYRCGQYVSVYIFVWRCRREKRQDERRGYGIQLQTSDEEIQASNFIRSPDSLQGPSVDSADDSHVSITQKMSRTKGLRTVHDEESEVPSIRAIFTALFITCLVAQLTSLTFFKKPEDRLLALSLLFSPLGVLVRWRMMKFNSWRPGFPLGTFACNVTACALSGTLGTLIAGKPGPRERIALVSIIAGFGGTLSSVARFIVEILSLIDPILFRLDGIYYAFASVGTGLLLSFLFAASVDWADSVE